jgi:hypothetical protein
MMIDEIVKDLEGSGRDLNRATLPTFSRRPQNICQCNRSSGPRFEPGTFRIRVTSEFFWFCFLFLGVAWDWVHVARRLLIGLLYHPRIIDDDEYGAFGGMRIGRGNWSTRRKPAPVPLCPPQMPHDLIWVRTRAAAVGSRRQTAWTMTRPSLERYSMPAGPVRRNEVFRIYNKLLQKESQSY